MALTIFLVVIFLVCIAMMWNEGMWTNALTLVNTTFAALLATNYFEPLADWLEGQLSSYTYLVDFISLWLVFVVSYGVLRYVTDSLSRHRMRFKMPMEHIGRVLFAAWTAWTIICFVTFTLHTAPLARSPFRGSFASEPRANSLLGMAPDRMWLGFVQSRSEGALSWPEPRVFDAKGEFIFKYGARRERLDRMNQRAGSIRVESR